MSNVFVFDPDDFREVYAPNFDKYTNAQLNWFFESIEGLLDNNESSCISLKNRKRWYYLLVAHKAELQNRINNGNSGLVGRISSATEGSVSISSDYPMGSGALEQWLKTTPYGAEFYAITLPWRSVLWFASSRPMPVRRSRFPYPSW